ncbi:MAG: putative 3'-5' exonuclease related to the exonuclease domain of PolB [Candidatus Omnitrophica bacterium ADurb.Bin292]|nr:MAG: putative 3'-5' exonuclease related to the exonuclease domain of PolB [Candidatus Omnitrophica bacterium ADurb.Bin292]HPW77494.1 ribonuclease H-like domain-containing protein [Candidatus Omnitrophota bacterium]HQB12663.1 ribonuclease H-like domain-containing protein [Candidatus Omnitrophota bacterium]
MIGKNILVMDLETQKSFKEVGKSKLDSLSKLKVSVVGVYDYLTDQYRTYEEKELMDLDKRIQTADMLIGFNIRRFDMPVLQPYIFKSVDLLPVLDLLDDIEKARGHRASLDSVARATLKEGKSGDGAEALLLYKEGRLTELKKYCLDDVRLTRGVYEYGYKEGKILFTSTWDYKTYEIPVNWRQSTEAFLSKKNTPGGNDFPTSLF